MIGGRCDGGWLVGETFDKGPHGPCRGCHYLVESDGEMRCQVMDGQEPARECPVLSEFIGFEGIQLYGVNKPPPKKMGWRR